MQESTPIILTENDFFALKKYVGQTSDKESAIYLSRELEYAIVVDDEMLPKTCVRLNSHVKIKEIPGNSLLDFRIVVPENEDVINKKISVLSSLGATLIGLSQSEKIEKAIDGKTRYYEIIEVINYS